MEVSTIGLDLAKNVFQVHGVSGEGALVFNRSLRRGQVLGFFEKLPPCLVGIEACGASHHWAREIAKREPAGWCSHMVAMRATKRSASFVASLSSCHSCRFVFSDFSTRKLRPVKTSCSLCSSWNSDSA